MDATRQRVYRRTGMWGACHADAPSGRPRVGERQVRALTGGAIANGKTKSIHSGSKPLRLTMKVGRSIAAEATWLMGKTCGGRTAVAQQCPRLLADGRRSRRQPMTGMGIMQSLRSAGRGCRRRRRAGRGGRLRVRAMSARWARQRHGAGGDDAAPHQRHNGVQQSGHATSRHGASHDGYVHADRARCQDGSGRRLVRIRRPWCRYFRYTSTRCACPIRGVREIPVVLPGCC